MNEVPTPELRIANLRDIAADPDLGPLARAIISEAADYLQRVKDGQA